MISHSPNVEIGRFEVVVGGPRQSAGAMCRCGQMHTPTSAPCWCWGRARSEEKP